MSVCPSVRMERRCSYWTDFRGIQYFSIFKKSVGRIQHSNLLYEDNHAACSLLVHCTNLWALFLFISVNVCSAHSHPFKQRLPLVLRSVFWTHIVYFLHKEPPSINFMNFFFFLIQDKPKNLSSPKNIKIRFIWQNTAYRAKSVSDRGRIVL
jgi:hypothetical protein